MKTHTLFFMFICLTLTACGPDEDPVDKQEPEKEWTYCEGNRIRSDADIVKYASSKCDAFEGGLDISTKEVTSLEGMQFLKYVGGQLTISATEVDDLAPLINVETIGFRIDISQNKNLTGCQAHGFAGAFKIPHSIEGNANETVCTRRPGT